MLGASALGTLSCIAVLHANSSPSMSMCDVIHPGVCAGDLEEVDPDPGAEDWEGDEQDAPAGLHHPSLCVL